jgi:hypothetical protein
MSLYQKSASIRAVAMSVFVVRAFVRLREMLATNHQLAAKIEELEHHVGAHDSAIHRLIDTIKELMAPPCASRRTIDFKLPAKTG